MGELCNEKLCPLVNSSHKSVATAPLLPYSYPSDSFVTKYGVDYGNSIMFALLAETARRFKRWILVFITNFCRSITSISRMCSNRTSLHSDLLHNYIHLTTQYSFTRNSAKHISIVYLEQNTTN